MSALKRPINPMPEYVAIALDEHGLKDAFNARPDYQKNDWMGWIANAKREETRLKRMHKMLAELKAGEGYMGMAWKPST